MTNMVTYVLLLIYTQFVKEIQDCLFLPDRRSLQGLWEYLKIAIPLALMQCTDWWVFELMVFTAGFYGVIDQAA
jgi:Na+-driven multidrug efflux pump